jgi:hypothetical protein
MGSGASGIDYPLTTGTPCLLLFNDREFSSYFNSGQVSPLANTLMHDLSYAVAIPLYQAVAGADFNIKTTGTLNIVADTINLSASAVNITGTLTINGQPYLSHTHTSGAEGSPTGPVIT